MDRRESLIDRVDRRLGMLWARMCGTLAAVAGLASAWSVLTIEDFSLSTYWPVLGFSLLMLVIARACFRSRTGLMDQLSEVPRDLPPRR